jgi:ribose-phosphate pyrophosphokinase
MNKYPFCILLNVKESMCPIGKRFGFSKFFFNGGEPHFRIIHIPHNYKNGDLINIQCRIANMNDLGMLMACVSALRNCTETASAKLVLTLPYFPGGRQDRVANVGECFTVKMYADVINSLGFTRVITLDNHSDVTGALINNWTAIPYENLIDEALGYYSNLRKNKIVLISPDAGATKKVEKAAQYLSFKGHTVDIVYCRKVRDTATGELKNFVVTNAAPLYSGKNVIYLMIDDICDGGGTFVGLGTELKQYLGDKKLHLLISHGIFSKGLKALSEYYSTITTTDSLPFVENWEWLQRNDRYLEKLNVVNIF